MFHNQTRARLAEIAVPYTNAISAESANSLASLSQRKTIGTNAAFGTGINRGKLSGTMGFGLDLDPAILPPVRRVGARCGFVYQS